MVDGFNVSISGPDEDEFETETVFAADDFLFFFVVIGGSAEMTKHHLWNPESIVGVFCDIDAIAVVGNGDSAIGGNCRFDVGHCFFIGCGGLKHADHVVSGIDDSFIEEFVESWIVGDGFPLNGIRRIFKDPHGRFYVFN